MNSNDSKTVIGFVKEADEPVQVVDAEGNVRILKPGDPVYQNETVINSSNGQVALELANGQVISLAPQQQLEMGADILKRLESPAAGEETTGSEGESSTQTSKPVQKPVTDSAPQSSEPEPPQSPEPAPRFSETVTIEREDAREEGQQDEESASDPLTETTSRSYSAPPPEIPQEPEAPAPVVINQAPEIQNQSFNIDENSVAAEPVAVGAVQALDPDSSQGLLFSITGGNDDGRFAIDPDTGELTVMEALNYEDTDRYDLTVEVTDSDGLKESATVTVNVNNVNEAPEAWQDTGTIDAGNVFVMDVLANDNDVDHNDSPANFSLDSIVIIDNEGNPVFGQGSVAIVNNRLQFTAGTDFDDLATGEPTTVTVRYVMSDDEGSTSESTVNIMVTGTSDDPMVTGDFTGTLIESDVGGSVVQATGAIGIDDVDTGDNPVFAAVSGVAGNNGYGSLDLDGAGNWTYTLNAATAESLDEGQEVTDTVTLTATDGTTQVITLTITGTDDAPVVTGTFTGAVTEGDSGGEVVTASGTLAISDMDESDNPVFAEITGVAGDNGYGTLDLDASGNWIYTLNAATADSLDAAQEVTDTVTLTATDGTTQVITLSIAGSNDVPTATVITDKIASEDSQFSFSLPDSSFTDVDAGDTLTYTASLGNGDDMPAWLSFDGATQTFSGTPANEDLGDIALRVTATDSAGVSVSSDFTVTVRNTNDAPEADAFTATFNEDNATITGQLVATDADGDAITYAITAQPENASDGTVSVDADGLFTLSGYDFNHLDNGASKDVTFTFSADDGQGDGVDTNTVTLTITGMDDAPVVTGTFTGTVTEGDNGGDAVTASGTLAISDVDDSDGPVFAEITGVAGNNGYGTLNLDASGNWVYTLNAATADSLDEGQEVTDTVTLTATNGTSQDIILTIAGTNDTPTVENIIKADEPSMVTLVEFNAREGLSQAELLNSGWAFIETDPLSDTVIQKSLSDVQVNNLGSNIAYLSSDGDASNIEGIVIQDNDGSGARNLPQMYYSFSNEELAAFKESGFTISIDIMQSNMFIAIGEPATAPTNNRYMFQNLIPNDSQFHTLEIEGHFNDDDQLIIDTVAVDGIAGTVPEATDDIRVGHYDDFTLNFGATSSRGAGVNRVLVLKSVDVSAPQLIITGDEDAPFSLEVPTDAFDDIDNGDSLTLSATQTDGSELPDWLGFNPETRIFTGTPGNDEVGELLVRLTATDSHNSEVFQDISITINNINDVPVATVITDKSADEDSAFSFTLPENSFTDIDAGDALTYTAALADGSALPAWLSFDGTTQTFSGTPANEDVGNITLRVTATDTAGEQVTSDFTITVANVNDVPVAEVFTASFNEDNATITGQLVATDADGDAITYAITAQPENASDGTVSVDADGLFTLSGYDFNHLDNGASKDVTFTFSADDGLGDGVGTNTVTLTITGMDDTPMVTGTFTGAVTEGDSGGDAVTASGTLAISDVDDSDSPVFSEVSDVAGNNGYGILNLDASGNWTYTLDAATAESLDEGQVVTDTVTLTATDGTTQDIILTITGSNDAPLVSEAVTLSAMDEDGTLSVTSSELLANAQDIDTSAVMTVTGLTADNGATVTPTANGWIIQPAADFNGVLTLDYQVSDGTSSTAATTTISVNAVNDAPTAADNTLTLEEDSSHTFTAADFGFSDIDTGDTLQTITITTLPTAGTLTLDGTAVTANQTITADNIGNLVFTPVADANADDYSSFQFTVSDGTASSEAKTLTFDVTAVNDAPEAADNTLTLEEDSSHTFTAADFGFSDVDTGDTLQTITITTLPTAGTLTLDGTAITANQTIMAAHIGNLVFSPVADANGDDYSSLKFTVSDGTANSAEQTLTFDVTAVADTAVISGDVSGTVAEDDATTLTVSGTLTVSDPDAGEAGFTAATVTGTYGSVTIDADGDWSYSADNTQTAIQSLGSSDSLTDTVDVQTIDGTTQTITLTITGTNDAPVIVSNTGNTLTEEDVNAGDVVATFSASDVDGDSLSYSLTGGNDNGYFAINSATGQVTLTQAGVNAINSDDGVDLTSVTLTATASDGAPSSSSMSADVNITRVNDNAPVISGLTTGQVHEEGVSVTFSSAAATHKTNSGRGPFNVIDGDGAEGGYWSYSASSVSAEPKLTMVLDGSQTLTSLSVNFETDDSGTPHRPEQIRVEYKDSDGSWVEYATHTTTGDEINKLSFLPVTTDTLRLTMIGNGDSPNGSVAINQITARNTGATGKLEASDLDDGNTVTFTEITDQAGTYGTLNLATDGSWTYELDNSLAQKLAAGESFSETFTVTAIDGAGKSTNETLTVAVNGQNDGPTAADNALTLDDTGALNADGNLIVTGTLRVADTDAGEASFTAGTFNGTYGTLTMGADGSWSYSTDNGQTAIQGLQGGGDISFTGVTATYEYHGGNWYVSRLLDGNTGNGWLIIDAERDNNHSATLTLDGTQRVDTVDLQWFHATDNKSDTVELEYQDSNGDWQSLGIFDVNDQLTQTISFNSVVTSQLRIYPRGQINIPYTNVAISEFSASAQAETLTDTIQVTTLDDTSHNIEITFTGSEDGPMATAITNPAATEDTPFTFTVLGDTFTDVDTSDVLTYSATLDDGNALPSWLSFNADNRTFSGTPANDDVGTITLRVTATDTSGESATSDFTVLVANVNDAPEAVDTTLTIVEDSSHTFVAADFGFSDIDTGDTLQSITITTLPGAGALTLSDAAVTASQVITTDDIGNLVYTPVANANGDNYASLQFTVSDGETSSATQTLTFNLAPVNDAPEITASGTLDYTENAPATAIADSVTLNDIDNTHLASANISISSGFVSTEDVLAFTDQNGITGNWDGSTGVLSLSGNATMEDYQTALRSVTYENTSEAPDENPRSVSFTVNDGTIGSAAAVATVNVIAVNDVVALTTPVMVDDVVDVSEQSAVTVSGAGEPASTVTLVASDGVTGVTGTATVGSDSQWSITDLDFSPLEDGSITITATQTHLDSSTDTASTTINYDGTVPALSDTDIAANSKDLLLTYDTELDIDSVPALADFSVTVDGVAAAVLNVSYLDSTTMRLSLDTAANNDSVITLDYTPGDNLIRSYPGLNNATGLSNQSVSISPDMQAPVRQDMEVTGDQLAINFNEDMVDTLIPDAGAFSVSLFGGGTRTITAVNIDGAKAILTLDSVVGDSDIVYLTYDTSLATANGGSALQDVQANTVSGFNNVFVVNETDGTAPSLNSATADGDVLTLTYSEEINSSATPDTSMFGVQVAGADHTVSSVAIAGNQVILTLATPVADGEAVTVSYSAPASNSGDNSDRIEDLTGFDAASFSMGSITVENITDTVAPTLDSASIEGNTLTITLSDTLNSNASINPDLFSVTAEGSTKTISAVNIDGNQLVLTLTDPVLDGEQIALDYTPPAASTLVDNDRAEDAAGNDLVATTGLQVTNTTNSEGAPVVVSVFSDDADQWYVEGDQIIIKVQFSERVEVDGLPTLQLETGTIDRFAEYVGGSGTDTLSFTYTVVTPDSVPDLDILSTDSLDLNGGIITDLLGSNALLTLPEPGSENSLAGNSAIQVSSVSPLISVTDSENFLINNVISLSGAGFEELLSAGEANTTDLTDRLDWSKLEWHVVDDNGNDTTVTFESSDIDSTLAVSEDTLNIRLTSEKIDALEAMTGFANAGSNDYLTVATGGFFANAAGNKADFSSTLIEVISLTSDGVAPMVTSIDSVTPDGEYATGSTIQLSVDFDSTVIVTGAPVLLLETGDKVRTAHYISGSNTGTLSFEYQVQDGDISADLDVYSNNALRLNGGSIAGLYGNEAVLTVPLATDNHSLASQSDISIDGEVPEVTLASAALAEEGAGWKLTLSGDHFETMIASGQVLNPSVTFNGDDLDNHFDWSKLELSLRQPDNSFSSLDITAEVISEAQVYEDRLEIIFDDGTGLITDNDGLSRFTGDVHIAVNSGFVADAPGNVASMDTLAETDVTVTTSGATIDRITADTPDDGYGIGGEIIIRVRFSEVVELQNYDSNDPLILLLNDRLPDGENPVGGNALYESGSGTRELVFRHTISAGENIDDLNYRSTDALTFASDLGLAAPSGGALVDGSGTSATLTLPALESSDSLAGTSHIEVDTVIPAAAVTGAAWDEENNQLLILGSDFDTLLGSTESTTVNLSNRLDWSKIRIDIDKDDGVTQDITLTASDVLSAKLAGNETITITLTDAKANELEGIFGYRGAEDGLDIVQGFLTDPSGNMTVQADIADLTLDYSDLASPLVTRVSLATPGHFKSGDEVVIQVEMSEVVNITGIDASDDSTKPTLTLNNGATATYTGGSGTSALLFSYTVGADAGENTDSLNYTSSDALTIPAGLSIFDGTGNSAITTLPDINSNDALGQSSQGVIDIDAPTVLLLDSITPDGTYKEGELIQIEIRINETVEIEGVPLLKMNTGGTASYASGSGSDTLVFNYIVQAGDNVGTLHVATSNPEYFDLTNGSIKDLAGNDLDVSNMPVNNDAQSFKSQSDIAIDTTNPAFDFGEASFFVRPEKANSAYPAYSIALWDHSRVVQAEYDTVNPTTSGNTQPIESSHLIDWNKIYIEYTDDNFNRQKLYLNDDVVELIYGATNHTLVTIGIDLNYVMENGALSTWDYNTLGDTFSDTDTADNYADNANNDGVIGFHTTFVMESGALPDAAGNFNDTAIVKNLNNFYDFTPNPAWDKNNVGTDGETVTTLLLPEVTKVSFADTEQQFYRVGDEITINVHYNQVVRVRSTTSDDSSWPEITLNNGATASFDTSTLNVSKASDGADNTAFAGRVLKFTYTVQEGDDISSLDIAGSTSITLNNSRIENGYGMHELAFGTDRDAIGDFDRTANLDLPVPGTDKTLSDQLEVSIKTTPAAATITDASYDIATGLLNLNGSGFEGILSGSATGESVDLKQILDWSKLTYKVNGTDALTFAEADIVSARILNDGSLQMQLSTVKMDAIAALTAGDAGDDRVDIAAGLIRDLAGNISTTDGITNATVTAADLKPPVLDQVLASDNDLALVFDETLSGTPDASEFTVRVNGAERTLTTVDVTDNTTTLTFDGAAVTASDQVIFDYTGSSLADGDGNTIATISEGVAGYSHNTTAGMETLLGDIGDDIFTIDHDDASVTAGSGSDTIYFNLSGNTADMADLTITDFHADEGDKLVLDDLIIDPGNNLDEYFHFTAVGDDTVMEISPVAGGDVTQRVTFKDVDLFSFGSTDSDIINNLLNNGNIDHGE